MEAGRIIPKSIAESLNVELCLRTAFSKPNLRNHRVLTDDVFTYVDFYFKKHNRKMITDDGDRIDTNHHVYWNQARQFYNASKMLPIESAPLTMYYCMLNAAKAHILYNSPTVSKTLLENMRIHGLREANESSKTDHLENIKISRYQKGVFPYFSKMIDPAFPEKWEHGVDHPQTMNSMLGSLAFIHRAYASTYGIKHKNELFYPLLQETRPTFYRCSDNKIHLVVDLRKTYFTHKGKELPEYAKRHILPNFIIDASNPFRLISIEGYNRRTIKNQYENIRKHFAVISADRPIWYLQKESNILNELSIIMASTHRFSEIVRYKPEQMIELLKGKENWLIHEFLMLALDQFIEKLACEITKEEIVTTRHSFEV